MLNIEFYKKQREKMSILHACARAILLHENAPQSVYTRENPASATTTELNDWQTIRCMRAVVCPKFH